ncbi:hypothetical protein QE152_g27320 [Popillia japonica]|uniref:Uncharacterized protein n=1 Tax=Popillia japonica TaxID=7064 RepID=A0AAW1JTD3_POPJA
MQFCKERQLLFSIRPAFEVSEVDTAAVEFVQIPIVDTAAVEFVQIPIVDISDEADEENQSESCVQDEDTDSRE